MTADRVGEGKNPATREQFIPVRKSDILQRLLTHGGLPPDERDRFYQLCRLLGAIYHYEYFDRLERLRDDYYYFNPDLPAEPPLEPVARERAHAELVDTLVAVLKDANFIELPAAEIAAAHAERHVLRVTVEIPLQEYREVKVFYRGHHTAIAEISEWLGLRRRTAEFEVYNHVVLMVMIKPAAELAKRQVVRLASRNLRPGAILIKYFRDIARPDLNMLFPDVRVVMSLFDKMMLGVPALAGGVPIILNLLPTISVLFLVIGFYLGFAGTVQDDDMKKALAAVSGLAALVGFVMRQFLKYQRQALKYHKQISDNVYFRNIDNNAGIFDFIIAAAEEQEVKEAFLAYFFLCTAAIPPIKTALDESIERWLKDNFTVELDFDVDAALVKLERLGLLRRDGEHLAVPSLADALVVLDRRWDDYFSPAGTAR